MNSAIPAHIQEPVELKSATILSFPSKGQNSLQNSEKMVGSTDTPNMAALMLQVARERDRAAFVQIYEYFAPRVNSFLLGKNLAPQPAEEILQEVMLAVWQKAHMYSPDKAAVSTWIFTIARNKHIDRIRQQKFPDFDVEEPDLQPSEAASVDDDCGTAQSNAAVREALSKLPKDQREVIYLSFMRGLAHAEIGKQLGLPLGTVKSRIRLGFKRLREDLGEFS